jgi:hypothetical protein
VSRVSQKRKGTGFQSTTPLPPMSRIVRACRSSSRRLVYGVGPVHAENAGAGYGLRGEPRPDPDVWREQLRSEDGPSPHRPPGVRARSSSAASPRRHLPRCDSILSSRDPAMQMERGVEGQPCFPEAVLPAIACLGSRTVSRHRYGADAVARRAGTLGGSECLGPGGSRERVAVRPGG